MRKTKIFKLKKTPKSLNYFKDERMQYFWGAKFKMSCFQQKDTTSMLLICQQLLNSSTYIKLSQMLWQFLNGD